MNNSLDQSFQVINNGTIQLDGYDKDGGMPFDIVVERGNKKVGIEVSFQVTTNSTIERKAGPAAARYKLMHTNAYKIAYVLDGS
ncbi:MAG: restriction endonuclease, partial [Chloroflexi bacterium]|nr:restriction endonuclease [Chloroflexota bacterium]